MSQYLIGLILCAWFVLAANALSADLSDAITKKRAMPVLIRKEHNSLLQLTITTRQPNVTLRSIVVSCTGAANLDSLQFYYSNPDVESASEKAFGERLSAQSTMAFQGNVRLNAGANEFWLSCRLRLEANLTETVSAHIESIETSAGRIVPRATTPNVEKRIGIALRKHWDDGVHTYRIPAMATTPAGTLLVVYDMRRRARRDLQEDIDIGLLRSTDGGRSWESQRVIMDMGTYGGLPQEQNGCSDPGIIVDPKTGEIFCFAVWMHGRPGRHQWSDGGSEPGFEIGKAAQFMMVRSSDDGQTWSQPQNMTRTWKDPKWVLYAPSPQQGISLSDGTLVMPTGGRNEHDQRFSNLLVSRDHGKSWLVSRPASIGNTECQAVELTDGSVMLNCRTRRPTKFRTVVVTADLGQSWQPHTTNRRSLIEPNCNGSICRIDIGPQGERQTVLLFANPHSQSGRTHHSIQVSFDEGLTWPATHRMLLDEGRGNGYPSLSQIDDQHVGIVYEGSGAHLVFEKIPIAELVER